MIQYICSAGNPEGTDWTLMMEHEKEFTHEEFQDICEEAIAQCLDEEFNKNGLSFLSFLDLDSLLKKFEEKGFCIPLQKRVQYYIEPYWGEERIRSKRLIECLSRKDKE
jgi:hypothetical protein